MTYAGFCMDSEALRSRTDCAGKLRILFCPQPDGGLVPARAAEEFADADEVVFIPPEDASGVERASADVADFYFACRACEGKGPRLLMARNRLEAWEHVANSEAVGDAALSFGGRRSAVAQGVATPHLDRAGV